MITAQEAKERYLKQIDSYLIELIRKLDIMIIHASNEGRDCIVLENFLFDYGVEIQNKIKHKLHNLGYYFKEINNHKDLYISWNV